MPVRGPAVAIAWVLLALVLLFVEPGAPRGAELMLPAGGGATLAEAVAAALARNPGMTAAEQRALGAEAGVDVAHASFLPSVDLRLGSGYGWIAFEESADLPDGPYWTNQAVLQVRQRLWDAGRLDGRLLAAEARVEVATAETAQAAEDLALATVEAYLDALLAETLVEQNRRSLGVHRRISALVARQEGAGTATEADRLQAEGRVALAEASLAAAEGRLGVAAARLGSLSGLAFPDLAAGVLGLGLPPLPTGRVPSTDRIALARALESSPDLVAARANERRRGAELVMAEAAWWPTVDLVLLGRAAYGLPGLEGPFLEAAGLIELRWRLFDGLGTEAEVRRLSALSAASSYTLVDSRRLIAGRLAEALARLEGLKGRIAALERALDAQEQTTALYDQQFAIGERTLLALLDAQSELDRLRRLLLIAEIDRVRTVFTLAHTMGELREWLKDSPGVVALPHGLAELPSSARVERTLLASLGRSDLPLIEPMLGRDLQAALDVSPGHTGGHTSGYGKMESVEEDLSEQTAAVSVDMAVPPPGYGKHGSGASLEALLLLHLSDAAAIASPPETSRE